MPTTDENLQLLGGVLIVLSLALLFCWYSKGSSNERGYYDGFSSQLGPAMYGSWRNSDGFDVVRTLSREQIYDNMPDINFSKPITTLNGMTNPVRNMAMPVGLQDKVNHSSARWNVDGFIATPAIDRNAVSHRANQSARGSDLIVRDAVQTPLPVQTSADNMRDTSVTSVQMKLVRADPYSPAYASTNYNDMVTV